MIGGVIVGDETLRRFQKFKEVLVSADLPSGVLLDMIESYITSGSSGGDGESAAEEIPILDGQMLLYEFCA